MAALGFRFVHLRQTMTLEATMRNQSTQTTLCADHYTYLKKLSARIRTLTFKTSLTIIPAKKKRI